jgi:hypothetical protein
MTTTKILVTAIAWCFWWLILLAMIVFSDWRKRSQDERKRIAFTKADYRLFRRLVDERSKKAAKGGQR